MAMKFYTGGPGHSFKFSSEKKKVDWRRINAVNIDSLISKADIEALQEHIRDVTFCSLESVRCTRCLSPLDPTLVKLFRLGQLSLEWMQHCQEKLVLGLQYIEDKLKRSATEFLKLQTKTEKQEEKMRKMVSELKSRENIIEKQQYMFKKDIKNSLQVAFRC